MKCLSPKIAPIAPATAPIAITSPTTHWTAVLRVEYHARTRASRRLSPPPRPATRPEVASRAPNPGGAPPPRLDAVDERRRLGRKLAIHL
jgi:hypothetical protein